MSPRSAEYPRGTPRRCCDPSAECPRGSRGAAATRLRLFVVETKAQRPRYGCCDGTLLKNQGQKWYLKEGGETKLVMVPPARMWVWPYMIATFCLGVLCMMCCCPFAKPHYNIWAGKQKVATVDRARRNQPPHGVGDLSTGWRSTPRPLDAIARVAVSNPVAASTVIPTQVDKPTKQHGWRINVNDAALMVPAIALVIGPIMHPPPPAY